MSRAVRLIEAKGLFEAILSTPWAYVVRPISGDLWGFESPEIYETWCKYRFTDVTDANEEIKT